MAKKTTGKGFNGWPGRRTATTFDHLVSGVGSNVEETTTYSPAHTVEGAAPQAKPGRGSQSESAKDQRRGG